MTTLDAVARRSASAIETSVAAVPVPPVSTVSGLLPWAALRAAAGYTLAGAAGVVIAIVALLAISPTTEDVTDPTVPPTTVSTTTAPVPSTTPVSVPVIPVVPVDPDGDGTGGSDAPSIALVIVSPEDGATFNSGSIDVTGVATPNSTVSGPDGSATVAADDGLWSLTVPIAVGDNRLKFSATNDTGTAVAYLSVQRTPPPTTTTTTKPKPTTTTTEAAAWEFTAHNTYGTCAEDPPYDIYYGTGKPGTEITITSEHGGGSTVVEGDGTWSLKVFFPDAPLNVKFTVKVYDFTGAKKTFDFKHTE